MEKVGVTMEKIWRYIESLQQQHPFAKTIQVYGWEEQFETELISSVIPYLFEPLDIQEHLAPITNQNRDGRIKPKHYIVIHDTGDTAAHRNAQFWNQVVWTEQNEGKPYGASFQYVVGNDGIYHNIPDDEIAYHAGDSTQYDYTLYDTGVVGETLPHITIQDGNYAINGIATTIQAPLGGTTENINDLGILCQSIQGKYYIGETYYNETYHRVANRGGNNNGIGIEMCVCQQTDIYYTFQLAAKLVAYLMDRYQLTLENIKQHHYFSGKDCPETLRRNHLWNHFLNLVAVESHMLGFTQEGYAITCIPLSSHILPNGRITQKEQGVYQICIRKGTKQECRTFFTTVISQ